VKQDPLDAMQAARSLAPEDLAKLIAEKTPPSFEEQSKSALAGLLEEAKKLPGQELAAFVGAKQKELRQLELLHIKKNVNSVTFTQHELDGLLMVLDQLPEQDKADYAQRAQRGAHALGLPSQQMEAYSVKLTRLGLHT